MTLQLPTSSKYFYLELETDPETIVPTSARKVERVPVKLDRRNAFRPAEAGKTYIYRELARIRENEKDGRLPRNFG